VVCRQTDEKDFKKKEKFLKGKEFLKGLMDEKEKLALAYDKGGKHCRYMTSNMVEIFNNILRGMQGIMTRIKLQQGCMHKSNYT
jgi:hypothetical protein